MSELPLGWEQSTLGEVANYVNGRGFKKSEWSTTGRPIIRIQNLTGSGSDFNYFDGELDDRHTVRRGDLLVSWAATLGVHTWDQDREGALNQHIFKVIPKIDPAYLRYALEHALDDLRQQTHGSGMVHITKAKFEKTPIAVPPLAEQHRIVETLEYHLAHLDRGMELIESSVDSIGPTRRSLANSFLQESLAGHHRHYRLNEIADSIRNGMFVSRPAAEANGVPILRIGAVRSLNLDLGDLRYTAMSEDEVRNMNGLLSPGDLVFTRYNGNPEYVGACAVVSEQVQPLAFPDKLIRVRPNPDIIEPDYLAFACAYGVVREQIRSAVKTTAGQAGIAGSSIKSLLIPVPEKAAQRRAVEGFLSASESLARLAESIGHVKRRAGSLRRSLLLSAVSGELSNQDVSDDPVRHVTSAGSKPIGTMKTTRSSTRKVPVR